MVKQNTAIIGLITLALYLSGCTPTRLEEPRTILPEPTITRSPFEKCFETEKGIKYIITGDAVDAVFLTLENENGETEQGVYNLPFCRLFSGFRSGAFLYLSAQINQPTSGAGSIKCSIYDSDSIIAEDEASGLAAIATCSAFAR